MTTPLRLGSAIAAGLLTLVALTGGCGGGDGGSKTSSADAAAAPRALDAAPGDANSTSADALKETAPALTGIVANFSVGTAKTDTTCEAGGASIYVAGSMMWSVSCSGTAAGFSFAGNGPKLGVSSDAKNHSVLLRNAGGVLSGAPTTIKLDVKNWDAATKRFTGEIQAHFDAAGGQPPGDLTATFDLMLN